MGFENNLEKTAGPKEKVLVWIKENENLFDDKIGNYIQILSLVVGSMNDPTLLQEDRKKISEGLIQKEKDIDTFLNTFVSVLSNFDERDRVELLFSIYATRSNSDLDEFMDFYDQSRKYLNN